MLFLVTVSSIVRIVFLGNIFRISKADSMNLAYFSSYTQLH